MRPDIRLIAVDLDGTLLNDRKEIPPDFVPMVEALYPRGVRFVLASGRQYFNLAAMFERIADKLFFFSENGGLVFDGAENIFCRPLPDDILPTLYHTGSAIPATTVLCGVKSAYISSACDPVGRENTAIYYKKRTFTDDPLAAVRAAGDSVVKVAVFDPVSAAERCEPHFAPFRDRLKVTLAGQSWIDIMRADVNKGIAIEFLQKRLGLAPDQCMAFGDYPNDLEMIRQVGLSYAMANGHPDLLAAARFRAPSNEDDGVMRVLRETFPDALRCPQLPPRKRPMKKIPFPTLLLFFFAAVVYAIGAATRAGVPGMVYDQIRESLGFTAAQTSAISSWGVAGCMAFLGVSGILTDRLGWRPVILAGIALQVFGEWLLYTFTAPAWVYAGAFLNGGGRTIGYLTLLKFLDSEFDRKYFSALIGVFYVFSYGGTLLGSSPFASLAADHPWQLILRWCNHLTTACGVAVAVCLLCSARTARRNPGAPAKQREPFPWGQLLVQLKKPQCVAVFFCAASGIVLYWSCLSGIGKKYLSDLCGAEAGALGTMNTVVMVEMIFAGSVSLFLGNRRKLFQAAGCALLAAGSAVLFAGTFLPAKSALAAAWTGFLLLGTGYGFTGIQITACREFVPPVFAASAIAFVNFCANVFLIAIAQLAGRLFDRFAVDGTLQAAPAGFRILLGVYLLIAVPAAVAACFLRDSKGRNISAEI